VVINGNAPGGDNELGTLARTLMQNVEVLSAGTDIKKDAEGKPIATQVVTLLVTPEQAERLSLATNQTTIQLVLRNPIDRDMAKVPGSALRYLFNATTPPKQGGPVRARPRTQPPALPVAQEKPAPAKESHTMEIIMGTKKSEANFTSAGEGK
jgi:pilus assembly protein CpaB